MDSTEAIALLRSLNKEMLEVQDYLIAVSEALVCLSSSEDSDWDLTWKSLFCLSQSPMVHPQSILELCGWEVISNGLRAGIGERRVLDTLFQIASLNFPAWLMTDIFSGETVKRGIQTGLEVNAQPFINQADLGGAEETVQALLVDLLELIH